MGKPIQKHVYFLAVFALCLMASYPAFAQTATNPACDPQIIEAQKARADMLKLRDACIRKEVLPQRASVIETTCFDNMARYAAREGGGIFSGGFQNDPNFLNIVLNTVISLISGGNFSDTLMNSLGVTFANTLGGAAAGVTCNALANMWQAAAQEGFVSGAKFFTVEEIASGNLPPGIGPRVQECFNTPDAQQIINTYNSYFAPGGGSIAARVNMPNPGQLQNATTLEETLAASGIPFTP